MLVRSKKDVDKYSKTFIHKVPEYKLDKRLNKLVKTGQEIDTFALVEKNRNLSLQEMIKRNMNIEDKVLDAKYADLTGISTDINDINIENRKNLEALEKYQQYSEKIEQEKYQKDIEQKALELMQKNKENEKL